ncbi:MAG: hypothetical protein JWQ79_2657 [Mucilaginibacter sp.]|nr:hypothetical protein [Mucilaginibacter sp.]
MKKTLLILLTVITIGLFSACDNFKPGYTYGNTAKEFMTSLMQKDYNKCISLMKLGDKTADKAYMDTIKSGLDYFHDKVEQQYGDNLNFSFLQTEKAFSANIKPVPNSTPIVLQLSNDKDLGAVEALFDNASGKIISIQPLDVKEPIPDRSSFWLFGALAICIALFNIYMLIRVWRSDMAYKWLQYPIIILVNLAAIGYSPAHGLFFKLASIQYTLGIDFIKLGYLGSTWVFGIPVGSLYILWQLKTGKYKKDETIKQKAQKNQIKGKRFKGKS